MSNLFSPLGDTQAKEQTGYWGFCFETGEDKDTSNHSQLSSRAGAGNTEGMNKIIIHMSSVDTRLHQLVVNEFCQNNVELCHFLQSPHPPHPSQTNLRHVKLLAF